MTLTKRRSIILLVLALCLALGSPVSSAIEVRDVPEGHWAYEAVRTLVERGYLPVGEDQLFRGDEPTDRYTLATVVAKMMAEVESGRVTTTPEDVRTLRSLTDELRSDLVQYYADVQRMEGQVAGAHEKLTAYEERLVQIIGELGTLYRRATTIEETIEAHRIAGQEELQAEVGQLKTELQQQIEALGGSLSSDVRSLRGDLDGLSELLDARSYELSAADADLRQQIQALSQSLQAEAAGLRGETVRLSERIEQEEIARALSIAELEDRINVSFNQHGLQLAGQATDTQERIAAINRQLNELEAALEVQLVEQHQAMQRQVADIAEELAAIESSLQRTAASTDDRLVSVDQAFAEVRQALNSHSEILAAYEILLNQVARDLEDQDAKLSQQLQGQGEALGRVQGQLVADVEQLRQVLEETRLNSQAVAQQTSALENALRVLEEELDVQVVSLQRENELMSGRIDDVRREMLILESQIGLSEEQVAELTQRVREEMAEQLTLSLVREGELQRGLAELRSEFDSYRQTSEADLKSARSAQAMGIGALVIGIIALLK